MDYTRISKIIDDIKFQYISTGNWDRIACQELFLLTRHVPLMVCKQRGISFDDQSDIVQSTYQEVFRNLHRLEDHRAFPRYLFVIADNICRRYWKRKYFSPEFTDTPHDILSIASCHQARQQSDDDAYRDNLRDSLEALPTMYRDVIHLYYFAGCTAQEIADRSNTSINTVTSRLRRARRMLKKILEGQS